MMELTWTSILLAVLGSIVTTALVFVVLVVRDRLRS